MASSGQRSGRADEDTELLRTTERDRLQALVNGDVERAAQLHTDDFQLINPLGGALSKEQYLGGISSGQIHYLYWEPETIAVRVYGDAAVIRYRSELEIVVQGRHIPRQWYWHTDVYERQGRSWRVVWSHATAAGS
jgi:ketosteroid isomerase-like protein